MAYTFEELFFSPSDANTILWLDENIASYSGDYYLYDFLNSKLRLTELGLYILDSIKGDSLKMESIKNLKNRFDIKWREQVLGLGVTNNFFI